jgi:hypothetical protein
VWRPPSEDEEVTVVETTMTAMTSVSGLHAASFLGAAGATRVPAHRGSTVVTTCIAFQQQGSGLSALGSFTAIREAYIVDRGRFGSAAARKASALLPTAVLPKNDVVDGVAGIRAWSPPV